MNKHSVVGGKKVLVPLFRFYYERLLIVKKHAKQQMTCLLVCGLQGILALNVSINSAGSGFKEPLYVTLRHENMKATITI